MHKSVRSIYARIETGSVHFVETADGLLLLCAVPGLSESRRRRRNKRKTEKTGLEFAGGTK